MRTITIFHPAHTHINGGYTVFYGDRVGYEISPEGELFIADWCTENQTGSAVFARGAWAYVCTSSDREAKGE